MCDIIRFIDQRSRLALQRPRDRSKLAQPNPDLTAQHRVNRRSRTPDARGQQADPQAHRETTLIDRTADHPANT